jgi:DNA-binding CsgD family transcriptional regulator/tetratricopeptide (TPR) repeat protein
VRELSAGAAVDAQQVYDQTAGNPFFVAEILATPADGRVPGTVVDAVMARFARLPPIVRGAVEQLAIMPFTVDWWLVEALVTGGVAALAPAERRGLLAVSPDRVAFRHELTRRAIADSSPLARRAACHRRVLAALVARDGSELSRIVHHAAEAGDHNAVAMYAPEAGREATRAGAHQQAAAYFRLAVGQRDRYPPADLADILEEYAAECSTIGAANEALEAQREAVELRRVLGGPLRLGTAVQELARISWRSGDGLSNVKAAAEAVAVLEEAGDRRLLAGALARLASAYMVTDRNAKCVEVGERAVALARQVGDRSVLADAMCSVGTSRWLLGDPAGRAMLEESLQVGRSTQDDQTVLRAYGNLVWELLDHFLTDEAARHVADGIALAERTEHLYHATNLRVQRGRLRFLQGAWDEAAHIAGDAMPAVPPDRCQALILLGRVQSRRGEPGSERVLQRAWELAAELGELQNLAPAATARAEAAWLRGDQAGVHAAIAPIYDDVCRLGVFAVQAELAYWLTKIGHPAQPMLAENPYALLASGRWREAAEFWRAARCPYEHAMALADSPDPVDRLGALTQLAALGAVPLSRVVRAELRRLGVARVPRGPLAATRSNPAGLTERQTQVAGMLGGGLTNAQIAERLFVSTRTVDSHVAAVLDKLGARNRQDAAARAVELGLLEKDPHSGRHAAGRGTGQTGAGRNR